MFLFRQLLQDIDKYQVTDKKQLLNLRQSAWRVIFTACISLLVVHYLKYQTAFYAFLQFLEKQLGLTPNYLLNMLHQSHFSELYSQIWWGVWQIIGFIILPLLCIRYLIKEPISEYGLSLNESYQHKLGYLLLATPIMLFAIMASFRSDFSQHYPFYSLASRSYFDLIIWELIYISQFVAVEFFFRGFLLNGLKRQFGSLSIAIMMLPYLMLHFPKLWLEASGSFLFGFFLGILALKSRSIWGGVFVHVAIALTMDIAALIQGKQWPISFFPNF